MAPSAMRQVLRRVAVPAGEGSAVEERDEAGLLVGCLRCSGRGSRFANLRVSDGVANDAYRYDRYDARESADPEHVSDLRPGTHWFCSRRTRPGCASVRVA